MLVGIKVNASEPIDELTKKEVKEMTDDQRAERILDLEQRLEEIQQMDLHELDRRDKRALRNEVKDIKSELEAQHNGGIYIGGGAVIIILLLIILL